jgi:hypothetical protein
MSTTIEGYRFILEPEDEYCHTPDPAKNYNESMYFNVFDPTKKIGGWLRLGNRVNEGYAELSACLYLPDGRVGFMFNRPNIDNNDELNAGGMRVEVIEPFKRLRVTYDGTILLLTNPLEMAHPSRAFKNNPLVVCKVDLDYRGIAPMYGGRPVLEDGSEIPIDPEKSFAKAHYEQHVAATGSFDIGGQHWEIDGFGLRDKSWGPRYWQNISWYRWLPMSFGADFGIMISIIGLDGSAGAAEARRSGMVLRNGEYVMIKDTRIETEWDENWYQTKLRAWAKTDEREYVVEGTVISLIPLRHRRKGDDGTDLVTRITEGMTEYTCDGRIGYGMSEYLDQMIDGKPAGPDAK